jgi:hypothetical protein
MTSSLRGAIAAAFVAAAPLAALAQASAPPSAPTHSASSTAPAQAAYQSAFHGYRRFDDQKVLPWRDANDNVGRIGGWQAYARESAGDEPAAAKPAAQPASMPHDGRTGHDGHPVPKKQ